MLFLPGVLFFMSLLSAMVFLGLAVSSIVTRRFSFYPPPAPECWQRHLFIFLCRGFFYPLAILSFWQFELQQGPWAALYYLIGGALFLIGFGLALWITFDMGWRNAFGEKRGLKTKGWFSMSRNPVYVATWIGLVGWALLVNDLYVRILLALWALLYALAPYLEEPWLEEHYGDQYRAYKKTVKRFF